MNSQIKAHLNKVTKEGYSLHQVTFSSQPGCLACGFQNRGRRLRKFMVTLIGKRLEDKRLYLYSIVKLCKDTCLVSQKVHEDLLARLLATVETPN